METTATPDSILFSPLVTTVVGTFLVAFLSVMGWVMVHIFKLNGNVQAIAAKQDAQSKQIDLLREEMVRRLDKMDDRFEKMDERFAKMDERLGRMEVAIERIALERPLVTEPVLKPKP